MIILSNPVTLYGKKVVADLATRSGDVTINDYSYGPGLSYIVERYFTDRETDVNIEMLFNDMVDFNPDVKQPIQLDEDAEEYEYKGTEAGVCYNPATDPISFDRYIRRLEDIDTRYLESYIGNLTYTLVYSQEGGIKSYNAKHRVQPCLPDNDDDDYTELSDLVLDVTKEEWSIDDKTIALQNLPYVIKRLHNMSCYSRVHMLSYIAAYVRAKELNYRKQMAGSQMILKKNAVIDQGVYICDNQGYIQKRIEKENKNVRMANMFEWITGNSNEWPSYHKDVQNFLHYCEVLNIDIINDDMTKYGPDFVNKLIVTTVTPNSQYDKQVFSAILNNTNSMPIEEEENIDVFDNTMSLFQQLCDINATFAEHMRKHDSTQAKFILDKAINLHYLHVLLNKGITLDTKKYEWISGLLHYDGEVVIMPANILGSTQFEDNRCLINELGYCIQLTKSNILCVLPIAIALDNVTHLMTKADDEYKIVDWLGYSV